MKKLSLSVLSLLIVFPCLAQIESSQSEDIWPRDWQSMEIESKWSVPNAATFNKIATKLMFGKLNSEIKNKFNLKVIRKFGAVPTRMVDYYYDTKDLKITNAGHALRLRKMWYVKNADDFYGFRNKDYNVGRVTQEGLVGEQKHETKPYWFYKTDRVQYKSDAHILHATWFRLEVGTDNSEDRKVTSEQILKGKPEAQNHPTILQLKEDHPSINIAELEVIRSVRDYRSRFVMCETDVSDEECHENPIYEISMDMQADIYDYQKKTHSSAIEMEIEILNEEGNMTRENMERLFKVSNFFEKKYKLTPSITSKGGVKIGK